MELQKQRRVHFALGQCPTASAAKTLTRCFHLREVILAQDGRSR
jgi:hypothetical protein